MAFGPLFQNGNPIANFLGDGQNQSPYSNSSALMGLGLGLLSGRTPQEQAGNAAANFYNDRQAARTTNRTLQLLRTQAPDLAQAVEAGTLPANDAFKLFYAQKLEAQKPKNNFLSAGGSLYDVDKQQWISPPAGTGGGEYGLNVIYGTDETGKTGIGQVGKDGSFHLVDTKGFQPVGATSNLNLGTTFQTRDKAGNVLSSTPIDNTGAANQTGLGKAQSDAATAVLPAKQIADQLSQQIAALKADPALPNILGPIDSRTPNFRSDSIAAQARLDQLKGGAFLSARQMLKGGGQITDYEGQRADKAIARMDQAQSPEDFKAALDEFNDAVQTGVQKLQMQAQGNFGVQPAAPGPAAPSGGSGVTSGGIKFSVGQ